MFGIVRRRSREQLIIDLYESILLERERLVLTLAEQAGKTPATRPLTPVELQRLDLDLPDEATRELTGVLADEEEELIAMKAVGIITEVEYEELMERLKRRSPDDIIE